MKNFKNPTKIINAVFDSVNLINRLKTLTLDDEKKSIFRSNLNYLKIMMNNESFVNLISETQKSEIESCINSCEQIDFNSLKSIIKPPIDGGIKTPYENFNFNFFKKTSGQRKYENISKNQTLISNLIRSIDKQPTENQLNEIQTLIDFTDKLLTDPSILTYLQSQPILGDPQEIINNLNSTQLQLKQSFDNVKNPIDNPKDPIKD